MSLIAYIYNHIKVWATAKSIDVTPNVLYVAGILSIDVEYINTKILLDLEHYILASLSDKSLKGDTGNYKIIDKINYVLAESRHDKTYVTLNIHFVRDDFNRSGLFEPSRKLPLNFEYDPDKLTSLGSGVYGNVYVTTGTAGTAGTVGKYALKLYKIRPSNRYESVLLEPSILTEISIMIRLSHPNILQLLDVTYAVERTLYFDESIGSVFPLASSNLSQYLSLNKLQKQQKDDITYQILKGFEYLHSRNIVHGDIKDQNILISPTSHGIEIKISDFGLSRILSCGSNHLKKVMYALEYRPPEIFWDLPFSYEADLWAIGTLLYRIYANTDLFSTFGDMSEAVLCDIYTKVGNPKSYMESVGISDFSSIDKCQQLLPHGYLKSFIHGNVPDAIGNFIIGLIKYDPKSRMKLNTIISDEYFNSVNANIKNMYNNIKMPNSCIESLEYRWIYPDAYGLSLISFERRNQILDQVRDIVIKYEIDMTALYYFVYLFDRSINSTIDDNNIGYFTAACLNISINYKSDNVTFLLNSFRGLPICSGLDLSHKIYLKMIWNILYTLNFDLDTPTWYDYMLEYTSEESVEARLYDIVKTDIIYKDNPNSIIKGILS